MRQLVYLSRVTRMLTDDDIHDLVDMARERNVADGVTGLLLYDGKRFIQALEGPHAAVTKIMARISVDRRHRDMVYMHDADVAERQFGTWSMRGRILRDSADAHRFYLEAKDLVRSVTEPSVLAAFIGFGSMGRVPFVRDVVRR